MTNWFEVYYTELIKYAEIVIQKRELRIDATDLVNQAYVDFFEKGEEFELADVKKYISNGGFRQLIQQKQTNSFGDWVKTKPNERNRICKHCNEILPIASFRFCKYEGWNYIRIVCLDCERKRHRELFIKWRQNTENRKRWNGYMREWRHTRGQNMPISDFRKMQADTRKPVQELVKRAMKSYYKREKENLSDVYIKKLIQHKGKVSPEAIIKKREELLEKRRLANSLALNNAA